MSSAGRSEDAVAVLRRRDRLELNIVVLTPVIASLCCRQFECISEED